MQRVTSTFSLTLMLALKCAHGQDLHALQACTRLGDDAARLSCYDVEMGTSKFDSGAARPQSATQPTAVDIRPQANFGDDGRLHIKTDTPPPKNLIGTSAGSISPPRRLVPADSGQRPGLGYYPGGFGARFQIERRNNHYPGLVGQLLHLFGRPQHQPQRRAQADHLAPHRESSWNTRSVISKR